MARVTILVLISGLFSCEGSGTYDANTRFDALQGAEVPVPFGEVSVGHGPGGLGHAIRSLSSDSGLAAMLWRSKAT